MSSSPLLLSSPHSGRTYPTDFGFICPFPLLRRLEDSWVDELLENAEIPVLKADVPRSYIDVNRAEDDLDPALLAETWPTPLHPTENTLQGLGLVRRLCKSGVPMYAAPLPLKTVQHRLENFYRPYHAALEARMTQAVTQHGHAYLLDVHSMPSRDAPNSTRQRPDIILGDRDGTSCAPAFTQRVQNELLGMGYSVAVNHPYKGQEILRRHSAPSRNRHALQLEINRKLYMNETTLEKHEGFAKLRTNLQNLFAFLPSPPRGGEGLKT